MAQNGLTWSEPGSFDERRYGQVRQIAGEIIADHGGASTSQALDLLEGEQGYATPKVDVRGVCFVGEAVLLVRERDDGRWTLPGGWADMSDLPSTAVEREVREEAGYIVRATKLVACFDRGQHGPVPPAPFTIWKLFFACEVLEQIAFDDLETTEVGWFTADGLPPLSIGRITQEQLDYCFAHHADPERPPDFD